MPPFDFTRQDGEGSILHQLDARIKFVSLFTMLVGLAFLRAPSVRQALSYLLFMMLIAVLGRLPVVQIAYTSTVVFPFVGFFSLLIYLAGNPSRAWAILTKSYLSALTVLLCMAVTPFADLVAAAIFFIFPQLLLQITQVIYRYLFVLTEQVRTMRIAFEARGGQKGKIAIRASSGIIAMLFSRSYQKALTIHHAMLSRNYSGSLPVKSFPPLRRWELGVLILSLGFVTGLQFIP